MANVMIGIPYEQMINLGNVVNVLFAFMEEVVLIDWYAQFGRNMLYVKLQIPGVWFIVYNGS